MAEMKGAEGSMTRVLAAVAMLAVSFASAEEFDPTVAPGTKQEAADLASRVAKERAALLSQQEFQRYLIEEAGPSVVTVYSEVRQRHIEGSKEITDTGGGVGSGFIVDAAKGWVVTNAHVVRDAGRNGRRQDKDGKGNLQNYYVLSSQVQIKLYEGSDKIAAELLDFDEDADIALVKISGPSIPLQEAKLGDDSKLRKGDIVMVFGAPKGRNDTPTFGTVTNLNHSFPGKGRLIEHDAPMNHGNSGGPLFDMDARVIGVNSYKVPATKENETIEGLNYAIPVSAVRKLVEKYRSKGHLHKTQTGFDLVAAPWGGLQVSNLIPGSPAADAFLLVKGDVLTSVDGLSLLPPTDTEGATSSDFLRWFQKYVAEKNPGDTIELGLQRPANLDQKVKITLY